MFTFRFLLFVLLFFFSRCVIIPTYTERTSIETINHMAETSTFSNVLIVGTGVVSSRVFLDNLYSELNKSLESRGVHSSFAFVGKVTSVNLDSLRNYKFDAYLIFKGTDSTILNMQKVKFIGYGPGIQTTAYGNQFREKYTVTLFTGQHRAVPLWKGILNVDFDLANNHKYANLSKMIIKEIEHEGLLLTN